MSDNSIGLVFWLLAFVAVVSATGAVTLRKTAQVFLSLSLNALAVTGLLSFLGFVGFATLYFFVVAVAAAILHLGFHKKINWVSENFQFETHSPAGWHFITALLIFAGCLLLISNTEVWQYANEERTKSFGELMSSLLDNYSLLMIFALVFITLLASIMLIKSKSGSK